MNGNNSHNNTHCSAKITTIKCYESLIEFVSANRIPKREKFTSIKLPHSTNLSMQKSFYSCVTDTRN